MKQNFIIDGDVYDVKIWEEQNMYLAECTELGTFSSGKTIKTARYNLKEASKMQLKGSLKGKEII